MMFGELIETHTDNENREKAQKGGGKEQRKSERV